MKDIEILKRLVNEANVQLNVLARLCNCSPSGLANYIRGVSLPTGSK